MTEFVRLCPAIGQTVRVSENGRDVAKLLIVSVSPAGNRCDGFYTNRSKGLKWAFYRRPNSNLFIENPGCGIALLKPLFSLDQADWDEFPQYI